MAPEEALGSGGWGERRKHQKRSTQGGAAQRCLKRLMWVDPLESRNERAQKTRQMLAEFPWTSAICDRFTLLGVPSAVSVAFLWRMMTHNDAVMTGGRQMDTPSHHSGATPLSKRQEVTAKQ